ncbi:MAG: GTP-binding protein [Acidimicrobiales bacterium]
MGSNIEVTVIGGYLGAGKTTLLNQILSSTTERLIVLVNDFGSINIDEQLIEHSDGDTMTLANGCICCTLVDGFAAALTTISDLADPPSRLVIEASGVADPASVAAYAHSPGFRLDGIITLADAETLVARAADKYVGDVVLQQLGAADLVILNKIDLLNESQREQVFEWLAANVTATVIESIQANVGLEVLFGIGPEQVVASSAKREPVGPEYETWNYTTPGPMDRAHVETLLAELPAGVVRVKGVIHFSDRPSERVVVHRVGVRLTLSVDGEWTGGDSTLVFIGLVGSRLLAD